VLDDDLAVVGEADAFVRDVRFGRGQPESTTRAYAGSIALFLRWCARAGRHWRDGVGRFGLFIAWLRRAGPQVSGLEVVPGAEVLAGPGHAPARSERRVNGVLTAVRGLVVHAVASGTAPAGLVWLLYEVAGRRDLPGAARGEDGRVAWRLRARHRLREPERRVDRASDEETPGLLRGCRPARDRLIVLLMGRAGLRRGEVCGLRRGDVRLLPDSSAPGCAVRGAHLHVVRRENPTGAWARSRRRRAVPAGFLVVQAFDAHEFGRVAVPGAAVSDFVLVNLARAPVGAPIRPDAVNALIAAAGRRSGLARAVSPHQLRHASGSNVADAGGEIDEIQDLPGHMSMSSSQVYLHPDPARLRAAADRVPSPGELAGPAR